MQQNRKCRWCGDKDEIVDQIINKYRWLVQKTRHEWVGEVIHLEVCKKLKLDHTTKFDHTANMHKPESILEYEMHK